MKKTISILLALVMVLALSIAAFADDDIPIASGSESQAVTAQYVSGSVDEPGTIYYVTIEWNTDKNSLQYADASSNYQWNPETLTYSGESNAAGWSGEAQYTVTVTNRSNAAVVAQASWESVEGITADCSYETGDTVTLISAADGITPGDNAAGVEQKGSITANIGTPTAGTIDDSSKTVGTLTVTLSAG